MPAHRKGRLHFLRYYRYYCVSLPAAFLDHSSQRKDQVTANML